jgi:cobalt/nickel transport protein
MKSTTKALLLIVVGLAVLLPFASMYPDGLEKVAESLGIKEHKSLWEGLIPDYTLPNMENPYITKLIGGLVGLLLVFSAAWIIGWIGTRKNHA